MARKMTDEQRTNISKALKGKTFTESHREAISKANKGKKRSEEIKAKLRNESVLRKKVKCVDTGIVYHSQQEASRATGISNSAISQVCRGTLMTAGGYRWEFVKGE